MRRPRYALAALPLGLVAAALGLALAASGGPHDPFERYAPEVDAAVAALNAGRFDEANERLTRYLRLRGCQGGVLQTPPEATDPADAAFDLGLGLFGTAERLGAPLADVADAPPVPEGQKPEPSPPERRSSVDCARMLLGALLERRLAPDLEARARFVRGNAAFLERRWDEALADYERALRLAPGSDDGGADPVGRDVAWNRALALRNREREKERENERERQNQGGQGGAPDAGKGGQGGSPDAPNAPDAGKNDPSGAPEPNGPGGAGGAGGGGQGPDDRNDREGQGGGQNDAPPPQGAGGQGPSAANGAPDAPRGANDQDERMLDQFEQAPTWQREEGKARGTGRRPRGVADK